MSRIDISLYGILDPEHCNGRDLAELAGIAAENGVTLLQYRDKVNGVRDQIDNVRKVLSSLVGSGIPLLVNDRVDVALATGAQGVHLGQSDMRVEDARKILGSSALVGLSIKTEEDARSAPVELLDYAFIGGVFETKSKDNPPGIGVAGWQELARILRGKNRKIPVGAIAGIDENNVSEVLGAGADGVALISGLFMAADVASACKTMAEIIRLSKSATNRTGIRK